MSSLIFASSLPAAYTQNGGDNCANPVALDVGTYFFDNEFMASTAPIFSGGTCGASATRPFFRDMFWVYTATQAGTVAISTDHPNAMLSVYDGVDCNAVCRAGALCSPATGSSECQVFSGVQVGDPFLIQIGSTGGSPIHGVLSIANQAGSCSGVAPDGLEDNDGPNQAALITPGSYLNLNLDSSDLDYYRLTTGPDSVLTVTVDSASQIYISGLGTYGGLIAPCSGPQVYRFYKAWDQVGGEFKFQVLGVDGTECVQYDMHVDVAGPAAAIQFDDCLEPNDSAATARQLSNGHYRGLFVHGDIHDIPTSPDYYTFWVEAGEQLRLNFDAAIWFIDRRNIVGRLFPPVGAPAAASDWFYMGYPNGYEVRWTNLTGVRAKAVMEVFKWNLKWTVGPDTNMYDMRVEGASEGPLVTTCDPNDINSTGSPTRLDAVWGTDGGSNLHLECTDGPPLYFGYALVAADSFDPGVILGDGRLCLSLTTGAGVGRYNVSGGAFNSLGLFDEQGVFQNAVGTSTVGSGFDVPTQLPQGGSTSAGTTWHFQVWHRDAAGQSNLSNAMGVSF